MNRPVYIVLVICIFCLAVMIPESRDFETYTFSFDHLGQVMSAQQPWTGESVTGIDLMTFGWMTSEFSWEIQELAFYQDRPQPSILTPGE